jgi:hypothetical protein
MFTHRSTTPSSLCMAANERRLRFADRVYWAIHWVRVVLWPLPVLTLLYSGLVASP